MNRQAHFLPYDSVSGEISSLRLICSRLLITCMVVSLYEALGGFGPEIKILVSYSLSGPKPDIEWGFSFPTIENWIQTPWISGFRAIFHLLCIAIFFLTARQIRDRVGWPCRTSVMLTALLGLIEGPGALYIFGSYCIEAWWIWQGKQRTISIIYVSGMLAAVLKGSVYLATSYYLVRAIRAILQFNAHQDSTRDTCSNPHISHPELL